jgi:solute carrier family 26 (sodium-independent sulfate anion transporter), member 11
VSPLEFVIWLAAVLVTIFSTIENGIYTSIASSAALLLVRIAHPRGYFLGKVTLHEDSPHSKQSRDVFIPLTHNGITTSHLKIIPPSPGVIVYRFEESYLYPNSSLVNSALVDYVKENMRRGKDMASVKLSDRPWNDPGPRVHGADAERATNESRPILHAIVLDFSTV